MSGDTWHLPGGIPGRLLRSLLGGGVAYFALFVLVHCVLAFTTPGNPLVEIIELVLICTPLGVLVLGRAMTPLLIAASAVALVAAGALGITALPTNGAWPGYQAWQLGAIAICLFAFALIRRYLAAWLTLIAVAAIAVIWSTTTGQGWATGLALVDRHFATLLVGTVFAWSVARSTATFTAYRALERRTRASERAAAARAAARRSGARSVLEQAGPMLQAIAEGRPMSDADRQEMLVLEGALRDQIRAPDLATGALPDAIAAARRRGVNVLLLDETEPHADPAARSRAAAWLADRVAACQGDRFVGRVRSTGEGVSVTAVAGAISDWASFPSPRSGAVRS